MRRPCRLCCLVSFIPDGSSLSREPQCVYGGALEYDGSRLSAKGTMIAESAISEPPLNTTLEP